MKPYTYLYSFPDISDKMYSLCSFTKPKWKQNLAVEAANDRAMDFPEENCCCKKIRVFTEDGVELITASVVPIIVEYELVDK